MSSSRPADPASLWRFIGNQALLRLWYRYDGGEPQSVLVKCEQYSLTGSIKDRVVLYAWQKAVASGDLQPGDLVVAAASEQVALSLAAIGRALGHRIKLFVADDLRPEMLRQIRSYGEEVEMGSHSSVEEMTAYRGICVLPLTDGRLQQETHEKTTGREIGHCLLLHQLRPQAFVAGVGSGASLLGAGKYLRTLYPAIGLHPVLGQRIPGLSAIGPAGLDMSLTVTDSEAMDMAQALAGLGLSVSLSSGANLAAAIRVQQELPAGAVVVTLFPAAAKHEPLAYGGGKIELLRYEQLGDAPIGLKI